MFNNLKMHRYRIFHNSAKNEMLSKFNEFSSYIMDLCLQNRLIYKAD